MMKWIGIINTPKICSVPNLASLGQRQAHLWMSQSDMWFPSIGTSPSTFSEAIADSLTEKTLPSFGTEPPK